MKQVMIRIFILLALLLGMTQVKAQTERRIYTGNELKARQVQVTEQNTKEGRSEDFVAAVRSEELSGRLNAIPEIESVERRHDAVCGDYYRCFIRQPCDHEHPEKGFFRQQFCLFHRSDTAAVVLVANGGCLDSLYRSEVATLLQANQILLETRYCGKSIPEGAVDWNTLTMRQVASDIHAVMNVLKKVLYSCHYRVSTGNGQGGLEALFHKRYFPEDVQQSVLYNTPLCSASPDKRVTRHQVNLGKPAKRFQGGGLRLGMSGGGFSFFPSSSELNFDIKDFQRYCFRHQDALLSLFETYSRERGLSFRRVGSLSRALQLVILEYRPAFFYRTVSKELIPYKDIDDPKLYFEHLVSVSDPFRFSDACLHAGEPMAWLALTETGSYKHFVRPFREFLPRDIDDRSFLYASDMPWTTALFRQEQMKAMKKWLQRDAKDILFIYGLLDIFSAAKVKLKKNNSCTLLVNPTQGCEGRIEDFNWGTCNYLKDLIVSHYRQFMKAYK